MAWHNIGRKPGHWPTNHDWWWGFGDRKYTRIRDGAYLEAWIRVLGKNRAWNSATIRENALATKEVHGGAVMVGTSWVLCSKKIAYAT